MRILITGTSKGIGRACACKFLALGHQVIGIDTLQSTIVSEDYIHYQQSILDPLPDIEGVQILINNAGVQGEHDHSAIPVNLQGTIAVTEKYAFNHHIKSVLFIASTSAHNGAEFPEYAASKGGMLAYMKNVAIRLGRFGATCNSLSPGGVITELNQHILDDSALYCDVLNETLLFKWATAEEIANWCYFFTLVNESCTGQDLIIDNGENSNFKFIW